MSTKRFLVAALTGVIMLGVTVAAYAAPAPAITGQDPQLVSPRPGMLNTAPIRWQQATSLGDQKVRVVFVSGVAPCSVLDRVTVDYGADEVAITLYEGSDPAAQGQACTMIATPKAVDVTLAEPLRGRAIVDGSEQRGSEQR